MNRLLNDRIEVLNLINEWNSTRLDLFKISEPNEVLDFYGVMRFYSQDADDKVTTKCIRVASSATTIDIIRVLMGKLRPDMKTLPNEKDFCIFEVHPNGEGRKLEMNERPLWIQLYWGKDQREGRFVLQNSSVSKPIESNFKERRESKKKKKHDNKYGIDENDTQSSIITPTAIVQSLYKSLPETNKFTRSLSNPEMVKKIQQDRLKQKFIKISTKEGGGTMKVFGDALNPSIPYKTFLLSVKDTAEWVVREMLEKYGLKREDPQNYCLLQIVIPPHDQMDNKTIKEVILHDKECPLNICLNHAQKNEGSIMFKVIKCSTEYIEIRKRLRAQESTLDIIQTPSIQDRTINDHLSMFVEVNNDGTELSTPRVFKIHPNITCVGRDARAGLAKQYFYVDGPGIDRDHCTIQNQNGIVTLTPHGEIWLNGKLISTSFILQHGAIICFGRNSTFRYCDPQVVQKIKSLATNVKQKNGDKLGIHGSLPTLSMNGRNNNELGASHIQQKKILGNNAGDSGTKIDVLPGLLEVPAETEIRFLHAVFDNYPLNNIQFRLSPVYTLYMTLRYHLSPYGKANLLPVQKQEKVISLLHRIEDMINKKIEECQEHGGYLAYWIANTSEFLYFLKQDRDLSKISHPVQDHLSTYIHRSFYYFINLVQNELDKYLVALTNPRDDVERDIHIGFEENSSTNEKLSDARWIKLDINSNKYHQSTLGDILATLSSIMDLLRKCRVNAALTIQIFSQIFLYMNTWLFNRIVCCPELKLCSYFWGEKLSFRLKSIYDWAERQGLELASECHLAKVNQLCLLLQSPKRDMYDVKQLLSNNTFQINSIQITQILNNYVLNRNEPPISNHFSQALLSAVYKHVDENLSRAGFVIQLAEESDLNLPFVLPEDGYTCDNLRGIPQQLFEFIEPMSRLVLCRLFTNPHSLGMWTEFMQIPNMKNSNENSIETITLMKKGNSLGLSIVSAKGESQQFQGIYIKGIIPDSAAEDDGRLQPGDQIVCVDKVSLIDKTQEEAAETLKQCGPSVTLQILKDAANRQGLSVLLATPSENPSLISHQHAPTSSSTLFLENSNSYERLLPQNNVQQKQNVATRTHHQLAQPTNSPSSYEFASNTKSSPFNSHQHRFIQPARSTQIFSNDKINNHSSQSQQHQSNPNLFYSKQNLQSTDSIRSANQRQSFGNRNLSAVSPLVFREDIPPHQNGFSNKNHQIKYITRSKSAIAPKPLPKPLISTHVLMKPPNPTNDIDITSRLSKTSLSSSDQLTSSTRKSQPEQQESTKLVNTRQNNISELRLKRINDLVIKTNRAEHEEKELNNLKLEDEFDRRAEEFHYPTNHREAYSLSADEMDEFDEKLKRRLEQFEHEREIERAHINRMLVKREADIEARLRKDREREIRADRDMLDFKTRRLSEEDQKLEAKKEQARLLKYIHLPTSTDKDNQSSIQDIERITRRDDFYSKFLQQTPSIIGAQEVYLDPRLRTKQQDNKENQSGVITETMSFKDKLKLFRKSPDQFE